MKIKENGRSMVEMLGVLAIIGVLSIGGIAGYTMAMNRYRANELLDIASKLSVLAQSSNMTEDEWDGYYFYSPEGVAASGINLYDYGMSTSYETTFDVQLNGNVMLYTGKEGIQNALDSITGVSGVGTARVPVIDVE